MKKILIFGAFHYDVAYLKTFKGYLPECLEIIDAALELLEEYPDYVFCIEQVLLVDAYCRRRPGKRALLKKFAAEKRLIFCPGLWTMPDCNIPGLESYYQNALLGRKWLLENLGVEPGPICWMADVFGHHAQSPQIYKQLGYKLYMFERGQFEDEPAVDFLWQGIDGTTLLTHWEADTYYGLNLGLDWLGRRSDEWVAGRIARYVVQPLVRAGQKTVFTKIGGDFLLPLKAHLEFSRKWNRNSWGPSIEFSHPAHYIDQLEKQSGLKTLKGEFNPLFQGTYSSRIGFKQYNRLLENIIYAIDSLAVYFQRENRTEAVWRDLATLQFHDIICGSLAYAPLKEAKASYEKLYRKVTRRLRQDLKSLQGGETIVYNPLPYRRKAVLDLSRGPELIALGPMELVTVKDVKKIKDYCPVKAGEKSLENGLIRINIDELGRLKQIVDISNGNIFADNRFGYLHDVMLEPDYGDPWTVHTGPANPPLLHSSPYYDPPKTSGIEFVFNGLQDKRGADAQCFNLPGIRIKVSKNHAQGSIVASYAGKYSVTYTLNAAEHMVRICVAHQYGSIRRRLRAIIPTGIQKGRIRREIPGGFIGQAEGEFPAQNWMDYGNHKQGLCLLNRGIPGNNVTDGVMMLTLFRSVAMIEKGVIPDFEQDVEHKAEYAIVPFSLKESSYHPARLARCFNQPPLVVEKARPPEQAALRLRLDSDTAEFSGVYFDTVKNCVIIRLYNSVGEANPVAIFSSQPLKEAFIITPGGKKLNALSLISRHTVKIKLRAFEIVTLQADLTA